jgi:hypothetical protein
MESSQTVPGDDAATETDEREPLFKPFDWMPDQMRDAGLLERNSFEVAQKVNDITRGVQVVLEILEQEDLNDEGPEERPLFGVYHRGVLMRYAIASLGVLQSTVDHHARWVEDYSKRARAA